MKFCLFIAFALPFFPLLVLQLDEWVLCRVKQKTSSPRNTWEDSNELSCEPTNNFQQVNGNFNPEPVKSSVQNEFPMLPYILASRSALPNSIGMASSAGFACNDDIKGYPIAHEDNLNIIGAQFLASAMEGLYNPQKRKAIEVNQLEYASPNKKLSLGVDDDKQRLEMDVSKGYNFSNFDQWTSIIQPQELNSLAFAGYK